MRSLVGDFLLQRLAAARANGVSEPTNRVLCSCLRSVIFDGTLAPHTRLPPTRDLSVELGVSRNTVLFAYEQLAAEGCVTSRTGSGTFVSDLRSEFSAVGASLSVDTRARSSEFQPVQLSKRGVDLIEHAAAIDVQWGAFLPGVPDVSAFPREVFAKILAKCSRRAPPQMSSYSTAGGFGGLRESLARYLSHARSVRCAPSQILIVEGVHQAVDLLARMMADPGDTAWVEEPGYWGTRNILRMNGLHVEGIPIDHEGMQEAKPSAHGAPRLAFVTPSHQYPLGAVMSLQRRLALLEASREYKFLVVEDDYDSEFRFSGLPIPSLQGLLPNAPVAYIGTFSKTLYPGLRMAYMVVPEELVSRLGAAQMELYRGGHLLTQRALAEFIDSGHYAAHIRRMRLVYGQRRLELAGLVSRTFGTESIHPYDSDAGLHLVMTLPANVSDGEVASLAAARGVMTRPLSKYYKEQQPHQGLLLGFAATAAQEMSAPFGRLAQVIQHLSGHGESKCVLDWVR